MATRPSAVALAAVTRVFFLGLALGAGVLVRHGLRLRDLDPAWSTKLLWIGVVAGVLALGVSFLGAELRLNITVSVIVVGFGAFAFNYYLVVSRPKQNRTTVEKAAFHETVPGFDKRSQMEVVRDLKGEGKDVVPALYGVYGMREHQPGGLMPLAGISTATTVFCNESGEFVLYGSDEYGFNNPPGLPRQADVAVLGDSFGHGQCVQQGEDVAGRLRAAGYRAVNLSCSGNGPLLELATLVEYAIPRETKVVFWLFFELNDGPELNAEIHNPLLHRYLDEDDFSQGLIDRQPDIDAYWKSYLERFERQKDDVAVDRTGDEKRDFRQMLTMWHLRGLLGLRRIDDAVGVLQNIGRVVGRANEVAARAGIQLYFVYLPSWARYGEIDYDGKPDLLRIVRETGTKTIDFDLVLGSRENPRSYFPFGLTGHYLPKGYALLAEQLIREALQDVPKRAVSPRTLEE